MKVKNKLPKILIAIPCMDSMDVRFVGCLDKLERVGDVSTSFSAGSLVYISRERLAEEAVEGGYDYVLWLDSDMVFDSDMLKRMLADDKDFLCGIFFRRRPPFTPVICKRLRAGITPEENETEDYLDYPEDTLFEIDACGFGAVLMKTKVIKDVHDRFNACFIPLPSYGEDLSFCIRARTCGYKIHCDSRIKVGHITQTVVDEESWKQIKETI